MKKRLLSILFTLAMCLGLLSVTALAVETEWEITVNNTQVTSSNQSNVLGDGKVSYDPDTNALSVNEFQGGDLTISGNGSTDVVINGTSDAPAVGKLTVTGAKDVTVTASCSAPAISNDAEITCSGNVEIANSNGFAVNGKLTVTGAKDVTVTASYVGPAISSAANITCAGNVTISNDSGFCVGNTLTVASAKDVNVTASYGGPAIMSTANITCAGNVTISNDSGFCVGSTLTVASAKDVTVTASYGGPAINGTIGFGAKINCTGDVKIVNANGMAVGNALTIENAKNVTVTANNNGPAIVNSATITCSGNVVLSNDIGFCVSNTLTVTGAKHVAVTANYDGPGISSAANITCSGNVTISNASGFAVGQLTVTGAKDVTVTANSSNPAICGAANITCTGDVKITNTRGMAVSSTLTVNGVGEDAPAQNVTVTANYGGPAIGGDYYAGIGANINCSGNVTIANEAGFALGGPLTVTGAKDVTVTANSSNPAICGAANITCTGDVKIENASGMAVGNALTVDGVGEDAPAQNVTVTVNYGGPAIGGAAEIACTGDVAISNDVGFCVASKLVVSGAKNVTVTATSSSPAIAGDPSAEIGAIISCSGDVRLTNASGFVVGSKLTISSARNVTVTANSSGTPALTRTADITCSGDVEIVNTGGMAVGNAFTYNKSDDSHGYVVKTGADPESLEVRATKAAGDTFGPETLGFAVRAVKTETTHILTHVEAKAATCTEDGNLEYWTCSVCDKLFSDAEGTTETTADDVKIPATNHTPGAWEYDSTQHWRHCTVCEEELDRADHTFSGKTCTVCGYTKPSTGGGVSTYATNVESADNGAVTITPRTASKGTTVTLTVVPDKGYTLETLTVTDRSGNEIELTNKGDGKYTFTMPASKVTVKATFMEDNSMLNFFVDVPANVYYYDAVQWAVKNGITYGTSDTTFSPDASCTRAQMAAFLWRAAGCPEPKGTSSFTDVPSDAYYAKAVAWAVENGITGGVGNDKFAPDDVCTRAQMAAFLCRLAGGKAEGTGTFTDVSADAYYAEAVQWAVENGITDGVGDNRFAPDVVCTRGQMATFLYRFFVK